MANKEDTFEKELKNIKIESKKAPFPDIDFELENGTDDNTINDKIVRPNTSTSLFDNIPDSKELMEEKKVDDVFRELERRKKTAEIQEKNDDYYHPFCIACFIYFFVIFKYVCIQK